MNSFEQQSADAIRNLTVTCAVLAVGLVLAIGLASWGMLKASGANRAVKAGLVGQTHNRALNVLLWCGHIDQIEHELTGYVARFRHVPRLKLDTLNCHAIANATIKSVK